MVKYFLWVENSFKLPVTVFELVRACPGFGPTYVHNHSLDPSAHPSTQGHKVQRRLDNCFLLHLSSLSIFHTLSMCPKQMY